MKTLILAAALVAVAAPAFADEVKTETVKSYEATTTAEVSATAEVSGTPVATSATEVHTEHKTEVKTEKKAK
jgi:hypothetical protein